MPYNRFKALIYKLILLVDRISPGFSHRKWVDNIRCSCIGDWLEQQESLMDKLMDEDVDEYISELFRQEQIRKSNLYKE